MLVSGRLRGVTVATFAALVSSGHVKPMWQPLNLTTTRVILDFSSSFGGLRHATQLNADSELLTNAIELIDWSDDPIRNGFWRARRTRRTTELAPVRDVRLRRSRAAWSAIHSDLPVPRSSRISRLASPLRRRPAGLVLSKGLVIGAA